MSNPTSTSTVPRKSKSSTVQIAPAQSVTAQTITHNSPVAKNDWLANNASWIVPLSLSLVLAGIVGYFTQIIQLKEDISNNKNQISLAQKDIQYLIDEDKKNDYQLNQINQLKLDSALMQSKIDQLSKSE